MEQKKSTDSILHNFFKTITDFVQSMYHNSPDFIDSLQGNEEEGGDDPVQGKECNKSTLSELYKVAAEAIELMHGNSSIEAGESDSSLEMPGQITYSEES